MAVRRRDVNLAALDRTALDREVDRQGSFAREQPRQKIDRGIGDVLNHEDRRLQLGRQTFDDLAERLYAAAGRAYSDDVTGWHTCTPSGCSVTKHTKVMTAAR